MSELDPLDEALMRDYLSRTDQREGIDLEELWRAVQRLLSALTPAEFRDLLRSTIAVMHIGQAVRTVRTDDDRRDAIAELSADLEREPPIAVFYLSAFLFVNPGVHLARLSSMVAEDDEALALLAKLERMDLLTEPVPPDFRPRPDPEAGDGGTHGA